MRHNSYRESPIGKGSAECLMPSVQSFLSRSLSLGLLNHVEPKKLCLFNNNYYGMNDNSWGERSESFFFASFPSTFMGSTSLRVDCNFPVSSWELNTSFLSPLACCCLAADFPTLYTSVCGVAHDQGIPACSPLTSCSCSVHG